MRTRVKGLPILPIKVSEKSHRGSPSRGGSSGGAPTFVYCFALLGGIKGVKGRANVLGKKVYTENYRSFKTSIEKRRTEKVSQTQKMCRE